MKTLAIVSDDVSLGIKCPVVGQKKVPLKTCERCKLFQGYSGRNLIRCAAPNKSPISMDDPRRDLYPPRNLFTLFEEEDEVDECE